jgi:ubiquinone/menaquinone biosynthesis C-methylase UbiE
MQDIKASIRKYWDWRSRTFGYDRDKSIIIADTWEAVLKELLPQPAGKRALDVGTGMGQFAFYLARAGFEVTGIDLSGEMIARAKRHATELHLPVDFVTGDAEALKFEDNTFDVLVSRNLLWTLPHPERALKQWRRVVKPGGRLVISDGFWMNTSWKRVHWLVYKTIKGMFQKTAMRSMRFFCSYARVQKWLPFYEGLRPEDAGALMQSACFRDIGYYDTACFGVHPYRGNGFVLKVPNFFIAYANK